MQKFLMISVLTSVRLLTETWIEMLMFPNICSMYMVRLLTETWVEMSFSDFDGFSNLVRLLVGMWVVILKVRLKNTWKKVFVHSRRRELKWYTRINTLAILSSSPRGDVNWNSTISCFSFQYTGSSPCGDVSWNEKQSKEYNRVIRFVSLRRRELKYTTPICKRLQSGSSSPYGDVSWNWANLWSQLIWPVRLLTETWVEIPCIKGRLLAL